MNGASVFSLLDLKARYHQIRMHEADCEKTAFQFGRGKYEFTRMPFTEECPGDVSAYGKHLEQLLQRFKEFGLKASDEKSCFFNPSVHFMGHILSRYGIHPDPGKVKAIRELQEPIGTLPSESGRSNGRVECTDKERGEVRYHGGSCEDPVLRFPDFLPFVITTDASQVALGAILTHVDFEGDRPVAHVSKMLTPAESRYSAIERVLLGVVWAVEHFRPYVWGRQFTIKPDHKPMVWVEGLKETSVRVTRWKEWLAPYNFRITHTRGRDNVVADCLSRTVNAIDSPSSPPDVHELVAWEPENFDLFWDPLRIGGSHLLPPVWTVAIGEQATNRNIQSSLGSILEVSRTYHVYHSTDTGRQLITVLNNAGLIAKDSILKEVTYKLTAVEDPMEQDQLIRDCHVGKTNHRGIRETVEHLRRRYYWVGMGRTVTAQLALCEVCARAKYVHVPEGPPQVVTPTPKTPQLKEALLLILVTVCTQEPWCWARGGSSRILWCEGSWKNFGFELTGRRRAIPGPMRGDEAWARALLAYNSSVHSAKRKTPLELMRSWQQRDPSVSAMDECDRLVNADERRKGE
ncbi:hypothetical protein AAG570_002970 [Ranatra chinensis]|uniref:RNA-directed DNA polymerase n=1 Tax=Ranatra chinensis TaxID=642074 RepID=A0ABD0Y5E3_9HEMI